MSVRGIKCLRSRSEKERARCAVKKQIPVYMYYIKMFRYLLNFISRMNGVFASYLLRIKFVNVRNNDVMLLLLLGVVLH
jgi:3-methyladenine DNA glycosylase Mpg